MMWMLKKLQFIVLVGWFLQLVGCGTEVGNGHNEKPRDQRGDIQHEAMTPGNSGGDYPSGPEKIEYDEANSVDAPEQTSQEVSENIVFKDPRVLVSSKCDSLIQKLIVSFNSDEIIEIISENNETLVLSKKSENLWEVLKGEEVVLEISVDESLQIESVRDVVEDKLIDRQECKSNNAKALGSNAELEFPYANEALDFDSFGSQSIEYKDGHKIIIWYMDADGQILQIKSVDLNTNEEIEINLGT